MALVMNISLFSHKFSNNVTSGVCRARCTMGRAREDLWHAVLINFETFDSHARGVDPLYDGRYLYVASCYQTAMGPWGPNPPERPKFVVYAPGTGRTPLPDVCSMLGPANTRGIGDSVNIAFDFIEAARHDWPLTSSPE